MNDQQYYEDKTMVSQSMLNDFVEYDEYGNRDIYPEVYAIRHIQGVELPIETSDAMTIGIIVDRYIVEGPKVLEEYPVVSRRSGDNPNEITKSMWEDVEKQIIYINNSPSFQSTINDPNTETQKVFQREIILPNGSLILKGKLDFYNEAKSYIKDGKTCGSIKEMFKTLQFKHKVNLTARYIRQLAYYMFIAGEDDNPNFYGSLLVTDTKGKIKEIKIRKDILDAAWNIIQDDLIELREYYNNEFKDLSVDPFEDLEVIDQDDLI